MPTPPVTVPHGQSVIWSSAASAVTFVGNALFGTATANPNNVSGQVTQFGSGPLANSNEHVTWSNFQIPNVLTRHDSVVHNIYAVIEYNGTVITTDTGCTLGGVALANSVWSTVPNRSFTGSDFVSKGSDKTIIPTLSTTVTLDQTLPIGGYGYTDFINITYVGIAIYIDTIPIPHIHIGISNDAYTSVGSN